MSKIRQFKTVDFGSVGVGKVFVRHFDNRSYKKTKQINAVHVDILTSANAVHLECPRKCVFINRNELVRIEI